MPPRPPKNAAASLTVLTRLSPAEVLYLAGQVAGDSGARGPKRLVTRVRPGKRTENSASFTISNVAVTGVVFEVQATENSSGGASVQTVITSYLTIQEKFLGLPAGPKRVSNYVTYRNYMVQLGRQIRVADPDAKLAVTES